MKHDVANTYSIIIVVLVYWIVSITTVFINKVLLSSEQIHLDAPLFITWSQCVVSAICYFIYSLIVKYQQTHHHRVSPFSWKTIKAVLPLSVVFTLMILFNNLCLKHVGVSFYYIGRSLTTVFNVVLTFVCLNEKTSLKVCLCCLIIAGGFWLGVDQEHFIGTFSFLGTVYGILGSLTLAYYSIKMKSVLKHTDNVIWILSYYNNLYSCFIFIPLILLNNEIDIVINYNNVKSIYFWTLIIISGFCGLGIGFVTALQIKFTSPLTHNISGTAKACAQTVMATFIYNESKSYLWWTSNYIVLGGSLAYAFVKHKELEKKTREPILKY